MSFTYSDKAFLFALFASFACSDETFSFVYSDETFSFVYSDETFSFACSDETFSFACSDETFSFASSDKASFTVIFILLMPVTLFCQKELPMQKARIFVLRKVPSSPRMYKQYPTKKV